MKSKLIVFFSVLLLSPLSFGPFSRNPFFNLFLPASADETAVSTETYQSDWGSGMDWLEHHPWRLYGGAAAGYGNVSSDAYSKAPDGPSVLLAGDLSYQTTRWVAEVGAGWNYTRLDGESDINTSISIRTRNAYGDVSVRYRLGQRWQLGPAYNINFGSDTHFGPTIGSSRALSLLGLRVDYEFAMGHFPFRIVLEGLNAIGTGDRNYFFTTLGFQIGLPFGSPSSSKGPGTTEVAETPIHMTSAAALENEVHIELDPEKVFFATNSEKIRPAVREVLSDIGNYLAQNENVWGSLEIRGHADQRGKADYNLKLSKKRSNSVLSVIEKSGVPESKVGVESYGFTKPADPENNPKAWARNRRVELIFRNVTDPASLKKEIEKLSTYQVPTLQGETGADHG